LKNDIFVVLNPEFRNNDEFSQDMEVYSQTNTLQIKARITTV